MVRNLLISLIVTASLVSGCKSPAQEAADVPASVDAEDTIDIPADVTPATPAAEVTQAAG